MRSAVVSRGVLDAIDQRGESIGHVAGSCLTAQNEVSQGAQPLGQAFQPLLAGLVGDALALSVGLGDQVLGGRGALPGHRHRRYGTVPLRRDAGGGGHLDPGVPVPGGGQGQLAPIIALSRQLRYK